MAVPGAGPRLFRRRNLALPLAGRRVHLARLPGHDRLARLLERLPEQLRRLGTGQGDLAVHDEERHARHAEAAGLLLTGPDDIQPLVARQQLVHLGPVEPGPGRHARRASPGRTGRGRR